jgi:predicted RNA binding protein YcfA (HicA-like mRNA interferase family)
MSPVETNRRKVVARLPKEGWENTGGGSHHKLVRKSGEKPVVDKDIAIVPRHDTLSPDVARAIAKAAGWQR